MPIGINPDSDKPAILQAGQYGLGGEAELTAIVARKVPNGDGYYVDFNVQVDTPDMGRLFVHSQPFGPFHTQTGRSAQASFAKAFMVAIGLDPMATFADEPDDKENHALLGPNPCPMKVVIDVTYDTYTDKKSGETKARNGIKSITKLG